MDRRQHEGRLEGSVPEVTRVPSGRGSFAETDPAVEYERGSEF
jgi:hypothetical protein